MENWKCPKCKNEEYEKDQFQATGGDFAKIFDDKVYDLINEGLCFTFEKNNGEEQVQYTYDMVAGFHIAKCILHKCGEDEDFKLFIDSNKGKFFGDKRHTLAEDIIKSLFYLVPKHYHKDIRREPKTLRIPL